MMMTMRTERERKGEWERERVWRHRVITVPSDAITVAAIAKSMQLAAGLAYLFFTERNPKSSNKKKEKGTSLRLDERTSKTSPQVRSTHTQLQNQNK